MMTKNKHGIEYYQIISKLLMELPNNTPLDIAVFFEKMNDWDLLSKEGQKVYKIISNHVWREK